MSILKNNPDITGGSMKKGQYRLTHTPSGVSIMVKAGMYPPEAEKHLLQKVARIEREKKCC